MKTNHRGVCSSFLSVYVVVSGKNRRIIVTRIESIRSKGKESSRARESKKGEGEGVEETTKFRTLIAAITSHTTR